MRPRIIFAAPRIPYPLNTGLHQRLFHILEALTDIGDVDLICYAEADQVAAGVDLEPLRRLCKRVEVLDPPKAEWLYPAQSYRGVIERYFVSPRAFAIAEFPGRSLANRIASLIDGADLIWTARLYVAEWIKGARDRMIVDLDDIEHVKRRRLLAMHQPGPYRMALLFDNLKLKLTETAAVRRYGRIAVCSNHDRQSFSSRRRDRVLVVPNGISDHLLSENQAELEPNSILFVGNMRYQPNLDAAFWFVHDIFPIIARSAPATRLYIVGHDDHGWARSLHDGRRIFVTGTVLDVVPFVRRAVVSVVPLRVGGGTRIKILESLALGTPVVSTTVGAEGLELIPGRQIEIADTPESFASKVLEILQDPGLRQDLSSVGREVVAKHYTWKVIGERLRCDVREFLQKCAPPGGRRASSVAVE